MKKKVVNVIAYIIISLSGFVILLSYFNRNRISYDEEMLDASFDDPITEVFFEDKLIDVGNLHKDTVIKQSYTIINRGINSLIIYYVNPDCNCTDYSIEKKIAPPGDSVRIHLTIETSQKKRGMFMVNTIVKMNTKDQMYRLRLIGNIID